MVQVVKHPVTGLVITPSKNNPDWGTFRVDSKETVVKNGILDIQKRTAFPRVRLEVAKALKLSDGKSLPGKIIRFESFEPFYEGQEPKINPTTGNEVLTDGKLTYLRTEWTMDDKAQDTWVYPEVESEVDEEAEVDGNPQPVGA